MPTGVVTASIRIRLQHSSGDSLDRPREHPAVKRTPIASSAIVSIGYDVEFKVLEVEFVSGAVYRYFDVPRATYHDMLESASRGRYLNRVVKLEEFRYERVQ